VTVPPRRRLALAFAAGLVATLVTTSPSTPAEARAGAVTSHHHRASHHKAHRAHHRTHHSRKVPRAYFGIHDASGAAYGRVPFGSIRLWDAGVTWKDIETSRGVYSWSRLDSLVSKAQAHHVQVTLTLGMTPSFYADKSSLAPRHLAAYARYVRAVMHRYRNFHGHRGIAAYQVWNEGNVQLFWSGTPHRLAQLTRVVDRVRNHVDPHATVVAPSFAVRLPYQRRWLSAYQRSHVAGRPVWHYYDANAISIYPKPKYGSRPGGPEDAMRLVDMTRHRLAEAGVPHRRGLWATEVNYGLIGGAVGMRSTAPISAKRQAANVMRTYLLGAAHGLDRMFWYRYDWGLLPASLGGGTLGNTLLSVPGHTTEVTAAGHALRTARRWLRGRLVATGHHRMPCARGRHGTYTCTVRYRHGTRTIMWNPHREVRVRLRHAASRHVVSGRAVVGARHRVTVKVGYRPVMVRSRR
jgi:hypothetical protein